MKCQIAQADPRIAVQPGTPLAEALKRLIQTDRLNGLIDDSAEWRQVPDSSGKSFAAQQALGRAGRPKSTPDHPMTPSEAPIFLKNVLAKGKQGWLQFDIDGQDWVALASPQPVLPGAITFTPACPTFQSWNGNAAECGRGSVYSLLHAGTTLAEALPDSVIGFNNHHAGDSLPQQHLNCGSRPPGLDWLAIEQALLGESQIKEGVPALWSNPRLYPVPAVIACGSGEFVANALTDAVLNWDTRDGRTGNLLFLGPHLDRPLTAVFFPRVSIWQKAVGFRSGAIAFCELAGVFVVSDRDEFDQIERGIYDYMHFWRALQSVAPPVGHSLRYKG
jgi:hypothetical protein